jgi:hypothetical protein
MTTYHHYMLVLKLVLSAGLFAASAWLLGSAVHNQDRLNQLRYFRR